MTAMARRLAARVLTDVFGGKKYTNLALQQALRSNRMEQRDRALCTELVYGTVQRQRSIDAVIQLHCHREVQDLDIRVLTILRMTVYQLAYLTRIPGYAAVNDAVELCKATSPKAAGFVNGVLRAFMRDKRPVADQLRTITEKCQSWADSTGLMYSYPTWLVERFERNFGQSRTVEILESCNRPSSLTVRVNPLQASREDVLEEMSHVYGDAAVPSPITPAGIRLQRGIDVEHASGYLEGRITVQDEGAMLIAPLLQLRPGQTVLDLCAGLGTKTTHIAELQGDSGRVDGCDIHQHKLKMMREAAQRLGLKSVRPVLSDARFLPSQASRRGAYDAVLLDAPCSGLGVLRHRPDIRWHRTPEDVNALSTLQIELLNAALDLVKPGGIVVYATCTMLTEENEQVVSQVLQQRGSDFVLDDFSDEIPPAVLDVAGKTSHGLLLTPEMFGTDGFYMARLRRKV